MAALPFENLVIQPFTQIEQNKFADANDPNYIKLHGLTQRLNQINGLWNDVALPANGRGTPELNNAITALKNGPKIVDLNSGVFLGGKSRHKNKKNNKSRRRNQSKKQRK